MKRFLVLGLAILMMVGFAGTGWASAILFIGNGATGSCPTGLESGCPEDPNSSLPGSELSIFLNGTESRILSNPLILIIGIPSGGDFDVYSGDAPPIDSVQYYDNFSPGNPVTNTVSSEEVSIWGDGSLTAGEKVYADSGYNDGANNSNSFANWAGATESLLELTPASFELYAYRLNENLGGQDLLNVIWAGAGLPLGTFAVAWGCNGLDLDCLDGNCEGRGGNPYSTPFTEAGMVPEPATMLLLGIGLIGMAAIGRKKVFQRKK